MKSLILALALLLLLAVVGSAEDVKLPVFFLRYEGGIGTEEIEPEEPAEELLMPSARRNTVSLRVKEQWNDRFTTNLYSTVSRKEYFLQSGSYLYFFLRPDFAWQLTDRIKWSAAFRSKWIWYDEPYADGSPKDLTSLLARTELSLRFPNQLRLNPYVQGVFDLYEKDENTRQTYTAGLGLESRLSGAWRLNGRYRSVMRVPLGGESVVRDRFNHEFGLNLSWDPNK